jgi:phage gp45-like
MSQPLRQIHAPSDLLVAARVGSIVRISDDGHVYVQFEGSAGEVGARLAIPAINTVDPAELCGSNVLLVFDGGDESRPIIVGFVRDSLRTGFAPGDTAGSANASVPRKIHAASVLIEAEREIVLQCGQGSISLSADGRIVIKGTRLTSRASETNKVRGAVVLIN